MTKVYLNPPEGLSLAMTRVARALVETAVPNGFTVVPTPDLADLVVLHVIGYPETVASIDTLRAQGKQYAIIQYCIRSTQEPSTEKWLPLWAGAQLVWSYYNLPALVAEDRQRELVPAFPFYYAPLGVSDVFRPWPVPKKATILTSGYVAESETLRECAEAVRRVDGRLVHLGPDHFDPPLVGQVAYLQGVSDGILSQAYARSHYVAGLRRAEGFELPAAEGLLCGARPVCYDRPHYRDWYGEFAEYITEGSAEEVTYQLTALFDGPYRSVSPEEIARAKALFDWKTITAGFWNQINSRATPIKSAPSKARKADLIWCGDAVVASGFSRATHHILTTLKDEFTINIVGLNYLGEPHPYDYRIHPAISREYPADSFGIKKLQKLATHYHPDVIFIQNDPWNFPNYLSRLPSANVCGAVAVDGLNCQGTKLNGLRLAVFWTEFALNEARRGGYVGPAEVIPLGVDLDLYKPRPELKRQLREQTLPAHLVDSFIVGNANRNQPRKRLDLTIRYFARWIKEYRISDALLYLQVAPTGDQGYDCRQLASYYGIENRLILVEPEVGMGMTEQALALTYNMWDAQVNTGQGEGFGLTTLEGMASGVPNAVGDWAALGDWAKDAALLVPCTSTAVTPNPQINVIGGIPDEKQFVEALHQLYTSEATRKSYADAGLALAREPRFRWDHIGTTYTRALHTHVLDVIR